MQSESPVQTSGGGGILQFGPSVHVPGQFGLTAPVSNTVQQVSSTQQPVVGSKRDVGFSCPPRASHPHSTHCWELLQQRFEFLPPHCVPTAAGEHSPVWGSSISQGPQLQSSAEWQTFSIQQPIGQSPPLSHGSPNPFANTNVATLRYSP